MRKFGSLLFALSTLAAVAPAQAQLDRYDTLANSRMVENRPSPETAKLLKDELLFQRATQNLSIRRRAMSAFDVS